MAHIRQKHTYDILLTEFLKIFQWFNPVVYLYDIALKQIHEYSADEEVIEQGFDSAEYKLLLLKTKIGVLSGIANNFNSLILKRLKMMDKSKSSKVAKLKLLLAVPAVLIVVLVFSCTNKNEFQTENEIKKQKIEVIDNEVKNEIVDIIITSNPDEVSLFPGGNEALYAFIRENVVYPEEAMEKGIEETIYVMFTVLQTGEVVNVKVAKGENELLKSEAVRVIKLLPNFKPAQKNGKPVNVEMVIPIVFKLS